MPRRAVEGGRNFPEDGDIYEDDLDPVDPPTPPDDPRAPRPIPQWPSLLQSSRSNSVNWMS